MPDAHCTGERVQRRPTSASVQSGTTELALIGYRQAATHTLTEDDIRSMVIRNDACWSVSSECCGQLALPRADSALYS